MPFLSGGVFGLLAAYLRRSLEETPLFEELRAKRGLSERVPLAVIVRDFRRQCVFALALIFVFATTSGTYFQYLPTYLVRQLHFQPEIVFTSNVAGVVAFVVSMPLWGALRDRLGWRWTLALGAVTGAGASVWFFTLLPTLKPDDTVLIEAFMIVGLASGCVHAMLPGLIASLFPTAVRQSGFAFPYSIGTAIFTGLTPIVLAGLVAQLGSTWPLYQYLIACAVIIGIAATVNALPLFLGGVRAPSADA